MIEVQTEEYNKHKIAVAHHHAASKNVVIFCHGFRGTSVGPNRFFVRAADKLQKAGIASVRFDQFGSGNSEGDFFDSSFIDWIATTKAIAVDYMNRGYKVALFGQSMGGACVIAVGAELEGITSVVAWVPDPNVDAFDPESGDSEEGGQKIQRAYWQEVHDTKVIDKLANLNVPALIVQCTDDEFVDATNREAILDNSRPSHKVISFEGYSHSSWTYDQAEEIIAQSVDFIIMFLKP